MRRTYTLHEKEKTIVTSAAFLFITLIVAFLFTYRYISVGGRLIRIDANHDKGFYVEYYLFIPETLKSLDSTFLLIEPNNTGFVDDNHKTHMDAAYDAVRFGQGSRLAIMLGIPLLVPCFDRPEIDWDIYTHALDRDTLLCNDGSLARIDKQLLAMIEDARIVLANKDIHTHSKILLNGFSASGSFVNRFTALYPEKVAGTAAGGVNGMAILPVGNIYGHELIYPVGIADIEEITELKFRLQQFASVPQFYYMGKEDDNDALLYDDAYSDLEREIIMKVLGVDMSVRWNNCQMIYESQGVNAEFNIYQGVGHEIIDEAEADVGSFFMKVIEAYNKEFG